MFYPQTKNTSTDCYREWFERRHKAIASIVNHQSYRDDNRKVLTIIYVYV